MVAAAFLVLIAGCGGESAGNAPPAHVPEPAAISALPPSEAPSASESPFDNSEPLVPAIRLAGDPAMPGDDEQEVVGLVLGNTPNLPLSLRTGILAPDFTADARAAFHPHGSQVCASGCAAQNHPTPELQRDEFHRLLTKYGQGPLDETNAALEALLFYGRQTNAFLESLSSVPLDLQREEFLRKELRKTHALFSFRVVDEQGIVRVEMKKVRVPLDRRHVFEMEHTNLQPLVSSGTVKRVGLYHLWTRI